MFNRVQYKQNAKAVYKSNRVHALVASLIGFILAGPSMTDVWYSVVDTTKTAVDFTYQYSNIWLSLLPFQGILIIISSIILLIVLSPIAILITNYYRSLANPDAPKTDELLNVRTLLRLASVAIVVSVLTLLGTMAFIIPGIYLSIVLRFAGLIAIDNPEYSVLDVLRKSFEMTKGNIFNMFITDLSFIGWIALVVVLGMFSFGVLSIFGTIVLNPYIELTFVEVYNSLSTRIDKLDAPVIDLNIESE